MEFTISDIEHLEKLAKINLEPAEREQLALQLGRIVVFVRALRAAGPAEEQFVAATTPVDVPEGDLPHECLDRSEVLAAAPEHENGLFRVPPVIESG